MYPKPLDSPSHNGSRVGPRAYRQWNDYQHGRGRKQTDDIRRMLLSLELPPPGVPAPIPAAHPTPANKLQNGTNEANSIAAPPPRAGSSRGPLQHQHAVPVGIEPVPLPRGVLVGGQDQFPAGERTD